MPASSGRAAGALPLLAAAALGWFGYRTVFFPERREALEAVRNESARLTAEIAERNRQAAASDAPEAAPPDDAAAVARELERSRRRLARLGTLAPAPSEAEELLHTLPGLAGDEGLAVRRFAPEGDREVGRYTARVGVLDAEGTYFDFVGFFERVAEIPRFVLAEEFELADSGAGEGRLRGRIRISVLSLDEPFDSDVPGAAP